MVKPGGWVVQKVINRGKKTLSESGWEWEEVRWWFNSNCHVPAWNGGRLILALIWIYKVILSYLWRRLVVDASMEGWGLGDEDLTEYMRQNVGLNLFSPCLLLKVALLHNAELTVYSHSVIVFSLSSISFSRAIFYTLKASAGWKCWAWWYKKPWERMKDWIGIKTSRQGDSFLFVNLTKKEYFV